MYVNPLVFCKKYSGITILFLMVSAAVIGKAIILPNCFAFDVTDDLNHTFTGLHTAKSMLRAGSIPFFNYYNNFGTPLMGDALTYPFAFQAIPYYLTNFEQYPLVATIVKFILCFATLSILTIFYRTFSIPIFASAVASIAVFFNFGFFWHFAHHHYQATLLCVVSILLIQKAAITKHNDKLLFIAVAFLYAIMIYSVSANLVIISAPFLLIHPLFYQPSRKQVLVNFAGLFTGGVLGGVQIIATWSAMLSSLRATTTYSEAYDIRYNITDLILKSLYGYHVPQGPFKGHIYTTTYLPVFITIAFIIGGYLFYKERDKKTFFIVSVLGGGPALIIALLLTYTAVWQNLPFFKSTDITRIGWICMIFVGIGVGKCIAAIQTACLNRNVTILITVFLFCSVSLHTWLALTQNCPTIYIMGGWLALLYFIACLLWCNPNNSTIKAQPNIIKRNWSFVSGMLALITVIASYYPIVHVLGGWKNPESCQSVNYFNKPSQLHPFFARKINRLSSSARFAVESESVRGIELIAETFERHGGGGRSIAMDKSLHAALLGRGIITDDDFLCGYHFINPWDRSTAQKLGMRYFATPETSYHDHWRYIDQWGSLYLYEHTDKPSIIYLINRDNTRHEIETFTIIGNDLYVTLPTNHIGGKVYITISARPAFIAFVDGTKQKIETDELGFICIPVLPSNRVIKISYNPLRLGWIF